MAQRGYLFASLLFLSAFVVHSGATSPWTLLSQLFGPFAWAAYLFVFVGLFVLVLTWTKRGRIAVLVGALGLISYYLLLNGPVFP